MTKALKDGEKIIGLEYKAQDGTTGKAFADMTIDASGHSGIVARKVAEREWDPELQNMALFGYWENAKTLPGVDAPNTLVEAHPEGWF